MRDSVWPRAKRQLGLSSGIAAVTTCRLAACRLVEAELQVPTVSMCSPSICQYGTVNQGSRHPLPQVG